MNGPELEAILAKPSKELRIALAAVLESQGPARLASWTDASKHANRLVHRLALIGEVSSLELLASSGVDINSQRSSDQCTPLHLAIWHGQPAVVQLLRRLGANAELQNSFGETAEDAERQRDRRYVCWHQQADLLVNISPIVLRRLFRERWALYAGNDAHVGQTILHGSDEKVVLSEHASIQRGSFSLKVKDDIRGAVVKGQMMWLRGVDVEAAAEPIWTPPVGRLLGGSEVRLETAWVGPDVCSGRVETQRTPPEPRLPPGADAYKKIRNGRVDAWDLTLLCHFLGEEQCRLAHRLVPKADERQLVRQLKDARNRVCLHQGRTEVEPEVVGATARLLQEACDALLPTSSDEVRRLVDEARSTTVVPERKLEQMEQWLSEERVKAKLMQDTVDSVSRFRHYLPPGAFSTTSTAPGAHTEENETASEWSATRGRSVWVSTGPSRSCCSAPELVEALALPPLCDALVVSKCVELAAGCPCGNTLLLVIRTASSKIDDVMLSKLSNPDVHKRWKDRRLIVADVHPTPELYEDWCLPDGVLVSGEHGRVLRVTAQFRPPEGAKHAGCPTMRRASDIACAIESVVIVSDGGKVYASTSEQAQRGEYVQLIAPDDVDSDCEAMSVFRGANTATEVAVEGGCSTAKKVWEFFWPHMQQREHLTQTLLPQAAEQVRRWSEGDAEITANSAELVSENTAKWLWTFICADQPLNLIEGALRTCKLVLQRLQDSGFNAYEPRLLIPMGESNRILGDVPEAISLLHRARKLGSEHSDFENGFSAHSMLFNMYVRLDKIGEARAMLVGAQLLLDKESDSQRVGPGMEDFMRAKRAFLKSNQARLDAKLALQSEESEALYKVKQMLEDSITEMTEMQGNQFRGNTDRNMAELLCLLCKVAWACGDTQGVRHALERELPLRRTRAQEGEAVVTLANLGRVCLETGDLDTAERYLSEAELTMQGLAGPTSDSHVTTSSHHAVRQEVLWMLATCAERQGDFKGALTQLHRLAEVLPKSIDDGSVSQEIKRVEALCRPPKGKDKKSQPLQITAPTEDLPGLDELAAFIEGGGPAAAARKASAGTGKAPTRKKRRPKA